MLSLAASALYPALMKSQVTNVLGGVLTFYLVTTATVGDVRMLVRGGVSGAQRIARHLWRMWRQVPGRGRPPFIRTRATGDVSRHFPV